MSHVRRETVKLKNDLEIDFTFKDQLYLGIGEVRIGGVRLRSGQRPLGVEIRTPDGVELCEFTIAGMECTADGAVLDLAVKARAGRVMEWMLHAIRNRYNTTDWNREPETVPETGLRLQIAAVTRRIGGEEYTGFSYQYMFHSKETAIYKILDRGTWEIGGRAAGNEFWLRNSFAPSIMRFVGDEDFYSTEWYLKSCGNPNVFQFQPLQTALQGFTFTSSKQGILATWPTKPAHVRSLFEKKRGLDEIEHWHEHCADLSMSFETAPMEVLWLAGDYDFVGRANRYEAMREMVHEELHGQAGLRRERVTTYGVIEEWTPADFARYNREGAPKLLEAGIKTIMITNHFHNNMNTWGVVDMCCTVEHRIPETVGEGNIKEMCRLAREKGARVEMWGNTALSTLTLIFDKRNGDADRIAFLPREGGIMAELAKTEDPWVRNLSGAIEADHYTPYFAVMNLRDGVVRDALLARWKHLHDALGIEGIFLDSSCNMSSDKFHYRQNPQPALHGGLAGAGGATSDQTSLLGQARPEREPAPEILSQFHAHLSLVAELQRMGFVYCGEDIGVFGIHRTGPAMATRLGSLPLWTECIANFDVPAIEKAGADAGDVFFRGLAYRMMWFVYWDIKRNCLSYYYQDVRGGYDLPTAWQLGLLRIFNQVNDCMRNREILPGEGGVLYRASGKRVLWAFADLELALPDTAEIRDLTEGSVEIGATLMARKHHVYETVAPQ